LYQQTKNTYFLTIVFNGRNWFSIYNDTDTFSNVDIFHITALYSTMKFEFWFKVLIFGTSLGIFIFAVVDFLTVLRQNARKPLYINNFNNHTLISPKFNPWSISNDKNFVAYSQYAYYTPNFDHSSGISTITILGLCRLDIIQLRIRCRILYEQPETSQDNIITEINGELDLINVLSQDIYDACYLRCKLK